MIVLMLLACAHRDVPPQVVLVPAQAVEAPDPVAGLLAAAGVVVGMPRERQQEEVARWTEALARTDLPTDRLRLALILALGDPEVQDPQRVRELLADRTWGDAAYETLARLILEVVETRDDGARTRGELEREKLRREELEQQVEALKAIEADIDARGEAG